MRKIYRVAVMTDNPERERIGRDMSKREYDGLQRGDFVWANFSNSRKLAVVRDKSSGKLLIQAQADCGRLLERWAQYRSCERHVGEPPITALA